MLKNLHDQIFRLLSRFFLWKRENDFPAAEDTKLLKLLQKQFNVGVLARPKEWRTKIFFFFEEKKTIFCYGKLFL